MTKYDMIGKVELEKCNCKFPPNSRLFKEVFEKIDNTCKIKFIRINQIQKIFQEGF